MSISARPSAEFLFDTRRWHRQFAGVSVVGTPIVVLFLFLAILPLHYAYIIEDDIEQLCLHQRIQASDIKFALHVIEKVDAQWLDAPLETRIRFQDMLFTWGLTYDYESDSFGAKEISPFYRLVTNKKDSELPSKSFLVAGVGFEPTTSGL